MNSGRLRGFEVFEKTLHGRMRFIGRVFIRGGHIDGVGKIEFQWMQIFDEDSGKIWGFDFFEETLHAKMQTFGRISIQGGHTCGIGRTKF
jgi:hypothetical protein